MLDRACGYEVTALGEPLGERLGELPQLRAGACVARSSGLLVERVDGFEESVDVDVEAGVPVGPGVDASGLWRYQTASDGIRRHRTRCPISHTDDHNP